MVDFTNIGKFLAGAGGREPIKPSRQSRLEQKASKLNPRSLSSKADQFSPLSNKRQVGATLAHRGKTTKTGASTRKKGSSNSVLESLFGGASRTPSANNGIFDNLNPFS